MTSAPNFDPYWWEAAPPPAIEPTPVAPSADAVVVGAGYTGLSAALTLARAGRTVQVFDLMRPGEGASSRNGGIVSGNLRFSFSRGVDVFGLARTKALYLEGQEAREDLWRFLEAEKIDCDFALRGRFTAAMRPAHYEAQAREVDLLNTHLDIGAYAVPKADQHTEIGSDAYSGGIVRPDIGTLHPAEYHAGLLRVALSSGATVHGQTAVLGIARERDGFTVRTARGDVKARDVIVGTNGYTDRSDSWLRRRLVPAASRIIATEPLSENLMRHLIPKGRSIVETRKLYRYYRPSPDGTRLLLGGREAAFSQDPSANTAHVRRSLAEIFPELKDVRLTHSWSGYVAFNRDQLPRLFERDGIHYAAGYCGSGTVWARWLGMKAALKVLGAPEANTALACDPPKAVPLYWGKPWFLPAAMAWFGLQDRYALGDKRLS